MDPVSTSNDMLCNCLVYVIAFGDWNVKACCAKPINFVSVFNYLLAVSSGV